MFLLPDSRLNEPFKPFSLPLRTLLLPINRLLLPRSLFTSPFNWFFWPPSKFPFPFMLLVGGKVSAEKAVCRSLRAGRMICGDYAVRCGLLVN